MVEKKCAVCGAGATQTHHLSYEPEIVINLCVPCHMKTIYLGQFGIGQCLFQKS